MAKYNLYKIIKERELDFIKKLEAVGLALSKEKQIDGFRVALYFSKEPEDIPIWWTDLYKEFLESGKRPTNKAHFAVFLISSDTLSYAVSMGKSHFYLKDYCEIDFGICLAERIASKEWKLKNSRLFGGKKNKTITAYQNYSEYEYDSGESVQYVKANSIDSDTWGKGISFGTSVQFSLELKPEDLPDFVLKIEAELKKAARLSIPRSEVIRDKNLIAKLDQKLIDGIIHQNEAGLQTEEAAVSGVDFIFLHKSNYRLSYGRISKEIAGELDIKVLADFIKENKVQLSLNTLDKIKLTVQDEYNKGYTRPVVHFITYVDDERHLLLDGKWHSFNENYVSHIKQQIERINFEDGGINFSNEEFGKHKESLPEEEKKKIYAEYYFNMKRGEEGYRVLDRVIEQFDRYKIEMADLIKGDALYFVKIGTPQKLGYVIDQSLASLKILQTNGFHLLPDDKQEKVGKLCLWLILERKTPLAKLSDFESFILLIKLAEWQRQCSNAGVMHCVRIGYRIEK